VAQRGETPARGVIDTLSAGYSHLNQRLWVLLIPIVVDLVLWRAPRITLEPLVRDVLAPRVQELAAVEQAGAAELQEALDGLRSLNLLSLLALGPIEVPSLIAVLGGGVGPALDVATGVTLGLIPVLFLAGTLLGAVFAAVLAQQVVWGKVVASVLPRDVWQGWYRMLVVAFALTAAGLAVGTPALLALAVLNLVSPLLAGLAALVLVAVATLLLPALWLLPPAVFVGRLGAWNAVVSSVRTFWRYPGGTLALLGLSLLITAGFGIIWERLSASAVGTLLGIVGNAYIATGLLAARMVFYHDRARSLDRAGQEEAA